MKRSDFIRNTLGGILAAVGLSKVAKAEPDRFDLKWTGDPMNSRVEASPSLNGKYKIYFDKATKYIEQHGHKLPFIP